MGYALDEPDQARLYFLQEQIMDMVRGENSSEELRLVASTVREICRVLSGLEKYQ